MSKVIRGSYFPEIKAQSMYYVLDVDGNILYSGHSHSVARLVAACMSPRMG